MEVIISRIRATKRGLVMIEWEESRKKVINQVLVRTVRRLMDFSSVCACISTSVVSGLKVFP